MLIKSPPTHADAVAALTKQGWSITADGPTGTQLAGKKKMRVLDVVCLVAGIICLLAVHWGVGATLIAIAVIDFVFMTKAPTKFIARPQQIPNA